MSVIGLIELAQFLRHAATLLVDRERERGPLARQAHHRSVGTGVDLKLRKSIEFQWARQ
jgi:hypothetical protein